MKEKNQHLYSPEKDKCIFLYGLSNVKGLPPYYGKSHSSYYIFDTTLCNKLFNIIYKDGKYEIVNEVINIIEAFPRAYTKVLKDKYLVNADVDKIIAQKEKINKYHTELKEIEQKLWREDIYKIGDEGYIIGGGYEVLYVSKDPMPKFTKISPQSASKIIRNNKFKVYSDMSGLESFEEFTEYADNSFKNYILDKVKLLKDPIYDLFITFQSI